MKDRANRLNNTKIWNIILMIITGISIAWGLFAIPSTLNPQREAYDYLEDLGLDPEPIYRHANTLPVKVVFIAGLLLAIILMLFYLRNHQKLKNSQQPDLHPYLIFVGWQLFDMLFSLVYDPMNANQLSFSGILSLLISYLFYCGIPLIILYNLWMIKKEAATFQ